jgi:hypothetical protein
MDSVSAKSSPKKYHACVPLTNNLELYISNLCANKDHVLCSIQMHALYEVLYFSSIKNKNIFK